MKSYKVLAGTAVLSLAFAAAAQRPTLNITPNKTPNKVLQLTGHTNNCYQIESSSNLVNWTPFGSYLTYSNTPYTQTINTTTNRQQYFRAKCLASASNMTYVTTCAENDNVIALLRKDAITYSITATHPTYTVTDYTLWSDFTDCNNTHAYSNYTFTAKSVKISDGGFYYDTIWAYRNTDFWRPIGMTVSVNGNTSTQETNMQQMVLVRYIPNSSGEWPNFLVLYSDGNMRLIPFPPSGHPLVSYGSSVIVGPVSITYSIDGIEPRPVCDILSVDYRTVAKQAYITYRNGGTALLDVSTVTRSNAIVTVTVNYPTDKPICALRSNYVSDQKCDTSTVIWKDLANASHTNLVGSFVGTVGNEWFFTRLIPSVTRNSSPDIRITAQ